MQGLTGIITALQPEENNESNLILTPREEEIFKLIMLGVSTKKIAQQLNIAENTVRSHRDKILLVNDCTTMLELLIKYHEDKSKL